MISLGTAAAIAKTGSAPIERVKLLIQNQGSMLAAGRLEVRYRLHTYFLSYLAFFLATL